MVAVYQSTMLRKRSSDVLSPRLPTLGHAGSINHWYGSSCFTWLLLTAGILIFSAESSAMPSTTLEGQGTAAVDLGALLEAGDGAVVTLVAGGNRLVAHRAVLAAASPVFATMLSNDSLEANSTEVAILDTEGPVLRQLVTFLYTGRAPLLSEMATQLLALAEEYGVSSLKDDCEQLLAEQLTVENAAATAVLAMTHNCSSLRQAVVTFIRTNVFQVMATQGWAKEVVSHPGAIVELTRLLWEPPKVTSAPAGAGSGVTSTTRPHTYDCRTLAAATSSSAHPDTPSLDEVTVSYLRNLSRLEKGRRFVQATRKNAVEEMKALLAAGAEVGLRVDSEWTPLHHAAVWGHVEAARCLLEAGAQVDARLAGSTTPLHWAAERGHVAVVRLLLAASANPNVRDWQRRTPLHYAALHGQAGVATALLQAGADKRARDRGGKSPRDLAREKNHQQLMQILGI